MRGCRRRGRRVFRQIGAPTPTPPNLVSKPLDGATWSDFAGLVEKHDGVVGGCWCLEFHAARAETPRSSAYSREAKQRLVREGRAHAALVYDGETAVGWCQFGPTNELPRIKHAREYRENLRGLPDWRITCFFIDRDYRRRGVAAAALEGALAQIARLGGGVVESYPEDMSGRQSSSSTLYNATLGLFERHGFTRTRRVGNHHWVVRQVVAAQPG